ncbi:hypothetical protein Fcan01_28244 [Folsomia candida]|uniref:Uncharacterized protein n=1 Tax=Folsomia candida TaxID=158441 RepID=A0A226CVG5_FOLCA|nr:hypothetical protein Fcan01_28244 [Folsomia candida]
MAIHATHAKLLSSKYLQTNIVTMFLHLFSLASCFCLTLAYMQEVGSFELDSGGIAIRFQIKEPDLTAYSHLLRDVKSLCYSGSWVGFNETNFTNLLSFDVFSPTETRVCRNWTLPLTMSLRYNGPLDLATPSVSIYNGTTSANLGGIERTFTGLSATNFGFVPKAIFITGRSSWTGFANEDFSGISTCFSTSELAGWGDLAGKEIRSFVQGCNSLFEKMFVPSRSLPIVATLLVINILINSPANCHHVHVNALRRRQDSYGCEAGRCWKYCNGDNRFRRIEFNSYWCWNSLSGRCSGTDDCDPDWLCFGSCKHPNAPRN